MLLDGGCLCFDFINTVHNRKEAGKPRDYLKEYHDLTILGKRVEMMSLKRLKKLSAHAKANPAKAEEVLKEMKEVRELFYSFFSAIAAGEKVKARDLKSFNHYLSESLSNLRFVTESKDLQLAWRSDEPYLKEPLWRIMKSAYDILNEEPFDRIKECELCGWIFLDESKNKSRRWCSMQTCGSIHKSKKYYHRKKRKEEA